MLQVIHGFQLMEPPPYHRCLHFLGTRFYCSILLRLHRSFKVSIGLDEASCSEAGGSRPGYTSALSAEHSSNPGNKITAQKLLST